MSNDFSEQNPKSKKVTRRAFNKTAGIGLGIAAMTTAPFPGKVLGANDRVLMGAIGLRNQGTSDAGDLLDTKKVEFIAACDVDQRELDKFVEKFNATYKLNIKPFHDFRDLLAIKEIDAVLIATPDHWHAIPFITACEMGKDIYCEKPISHNIVEGRAMVNAAKKYRRVVQIGSWQRSVQHFQDAIDFVRSGKLGKISVCRAWLLGNGGNIGHVSPTPPPDELDWDFWLGPASYKLYRSNMNLYWRNFFDYGGGQTADWGVHMMDIVCLAMGQWDPLEVSSFGGAFVLDDDRDTPDTQIALYKFKDFVMHWETRLGNERGLDGFNSGHGAEWIGTNGALIVDRSKWEVYPEGDKLPDKPTVVTDLKVSHYQNFVDCIKSRRRPRSDIETMHKTTVLCHLANIAIRTGKKLDWDAAREVITNEPAAMECPQFQREYRAPWSLPLHKM